MRRQTKVLIGILIVLFIIAAIFLLLSKKSSVKEGHVSAAGVEIPLLKNSDQIVKHTAYTLQYNEANEQPDWVAYFLTKERLHGNAKRENNFREDPDVETGSAQPEDYKRTGYDRGHMAPAADFSWSEKAMSESFFLSNMSPQVHSFNAGIWEELEKQVRQWADVEGDTLFIVSGPMLKEGLPTIGARQKLTVPAYFFKAILRKSSSGFSSIAFLMKHENSPAPLSSFAVTVDSLEKAVGIDFFYRLPENVQSEVEAGIDFSQWPGITSAKGHPRKNYSKKQ